MILITGITGYIGSHLALYFDKKKISYIGVDNLSYSYKSNLNNKKNLYISDISNLKKIESIIEKHNIHTVVHAAALSYVLEAEKEKKKYQINNLNKTKKFINLCKKKNIQHFIFLSSSNVYKESKNKKAFNEKSKIEPKNYYGKNKMIIERYLMKKNFKTLIALRLFNVIGKFNDNFKIFKFKKKNYQRIIFKIIQSLKSKEEIKINYLNIKNKKVFPARDFINIYDVVKIITFFVKKKTHKKNLNLTINVGTGKSISIDKIIDIFLKFFNYKLKINFTRISSKEFINTKADIKKLKKYIKYTPKLNIKKTLSSQLSI